MTNPDNVMSYIRKSYAITVYDSLNKNNSRAERSIFTVKIYLFLSV